MPRKAKASKSLVSRVAKLEKVHRQIEHGEDTETFTRTPGTTADIIDIGTVAQGDDKSNRQGDHIVIDRVYGHMLLTDYVKQYLAKLSRK